MESRQKQQCCLSRSLSHAAAQSRRLSIQPWGQGWALCYTMSLPPFPR